MSHERCPNCCQIWTGCTSRKDEEIHICDNCQEEWCLLDDDETDDKEQK